METTTTSPQVNTPPNRSESIKELAAALSKAQGAMNPAKKSTRNTFLNSNYADLLSCWDACREPLFQNGLDVIQLPRFDGDRVSVETILSHSSGEWISSILGIVPGYISKSGEFVAEKDAQAVGVSITYLRRYGLCSTVGIVTEEDEADDDGNSRKGSPSPMRGNFKPVTQSAPMKGSVNDRKNKAASEAQAKAEPTSDLKKTAHLEAIFKEHGIELKKALSYFVDNGCENLEEVTDQMVRAIEKRPLDFKAAVEKGDA